ncbi:MAG: type III-A CRISPR-associated RAMP protein Csm3, partial [Candidatus Bathyarchaeia archaeon]
MSDKVEKIKMKEIREFKGKLSVKGSGLHIGGAKEGAVMGDIDNPILRHPITNLPYVPGSSIKGKIRSLLESKYSKDSQKTGKPCTCGECFICKLFGCGDARNTRSPSRLVFRDCHPTEDTQKIWNEKGVDHEEKTEVLIDRRTGTSYGRIGPRTTERIPAWSDFDFSFSLRIFEGDNLKEFYEKLAEGFELLEKHYLGG